MIFLTYQFNMNVLRRVYDANMVAYKTPSPHPTRTLTRHDVFYILNGGFTIELGGQTVRAAKNSVVILPAGICHVGTENCEEGTKTLWVLIEKEELDGICVYGGGQESEGLLRLPPCVDVSGFPKVLRFFEKILLAQIDGEPVRASAYTSLLFCELYDAIQETEPDLMLAEKIRRYINTNLNRNVSNSDIAEQAGKSVKTVENVFKKHFGLTIHRYILTEKLKRGRTFLEYFPHMTIRDIADEMNFYDEYHFSRQFKKEYGVSPLEYKKSFFKDE